MVATIYLVNHGQTLFDQEGRIQGVTDSPLTKIGIKQAKKLREYFIENGINFDRAYCSTQERSSSTLELITNNELDYLRISELKARDYGLLEGHHKLSLPLRKLFFSPKVESDRDVEDRMERGMNLVLRDVQPNETILVVGHSDSMTQYLKMLAIDDKFHGFHHGSFVKLTVEGQVLEYVDSDWPGKNLTVLS